MPTIYNVFLLPQTSEISVEYAKNICGYFNCLNLLLTHLQQSETPWKLTVEHV